MGPSNRTLVGCALLGLFAAASVLAQESPPPPPPGGAGGDAVWVGGPPPDGPPPPPPGAQQQGQNNATPQRRQGQWQDRFSGLAGTITSIGADSITVKTVRGDNSTVKLTKDTAYRRDRAEANLSDFKTGEFVFIAVNGEQAKDGTWNARVVAMRSNLEGGIGQGSGGMMMRGGGMAEQFNPADLGKTFIAGEITKINETELTIHRPDGVDQVITVDEDTSFRNRRMRDESITLADFKVGDRVMGRGELKNGTFVPEVLSLMPARRQVQGPGQGGPPQPGQASQAGGTSTDAPPPPPPPPPDTTPKQE